MVSDVLLVEPDFPIPNKSRNHSNFLPIGLLKIATYLRNQKHMDITPSQLVRGKVHVQFEPRIIYITSLFTYWAPYAKDTVMFYRNCYPKARIILGGILATLMPDYCKSFTHNLEVHTGLHKGAEDAALRYGASYDLLDKNGVDYQIIHAMRGCIRHCDFCGTWRLEKREDVKLDLLIKNIEICGTKGVIGSMERNRLIFYDNNLLANNNIESLLERLSSLKLNGRRVSCESQSGFDGRILADRPHLGKLIKDAHFVVPRIAWDHKYSDAPLIHKQIDTLEKAGYDSRSIFTFVLYNWEISYEEMYKKVEQLWEWKVQISDCRFRPLNQTFDYFNPHMWREGQTDSNYYIHSKWSDLEVRAFRKLVRWHNIAIRHLGYPKYNDTYMEIKQRLSPENINKLKHINELQ